MHAVAWWVLGLLTARWWHTPIPGLLLVAAGGVLIRFRRLEALLLPIALAVAWADARATQHCLTRLEATLRREGTVWLTVVTMQPGVGRRPPRARGEVGEVANGARCHASATVEFAVPADGGRGRSLDGVAVDHVRVPQPGERVEITATVLRTASGVRLSNAVVRGRLAGRQWQEAWRASLGHTIDSAFGRRAPLVRALLIADQQDIAADVRDRYADAGLVHLLSVSGMHVAIIAGALLTVGSAIRVPGGWLEPLAISGVTWYVLLLGCPAPAVRSAVMLAVLSLSRRLQRPVHEWTALALGAVVPTVEPGVVHDLGWQLSVAGMAALVSARALERQWTSARSASGPAPGAGHLTRFRHWLGTRTGLSAWLVGETFTGIVAVVVTAPIIAWVFGRISLIAPLSNLVAGPVIALLQPALFLALLWALLLPAGVDDWVPDATQPLMALLDVITNLASNVPGAVVPVSPTLATAVGFGVASALVVRGTAARRGHRWYGGAMIVTVGTLWMPAVTRGSGTFELHLLDVGQGDAIAMRTPRGRWVLVDAGRRWAGGDAGRRAVVPYVRRRGGEVALFVLTHPHDDHAGGAASVVRALAPAQWWEPAFVTTSPGYRDALSAVRERGVPWERVRPGRRLVLDDVTVTVLAPDSSWTRTQEDANETSVVLRVEYGAHRFLLTGDAERNEEAWLVQRYAPDVLAADVLKLGHHGSRTSTTAALLAVVQPRLALASVGAGNRYGHPAPETLDALLARAVPVLRTDLEGTIVLRSDGRQLTVQVGDNRWIVPRARRVQ